MMSTDEEAAYLVGLEFKQRLDKLENDFCHFKIKQGPKGEKGQLGEKGAQGAKGKDGTTTIKHIYEPLPKEIREKMGSLGQIGGDTTQVKARKLMGDLEIMKDEIHELVQDKNKSIFSRSTEDMKKLENENSDLKIKLEDDKNVIKKLESDKDFIKTKLEEEIKTIKAIPRQFHLPSPLHQHLINYFLFRLHQVFCL